MRFCCHSLLFLEVAYDTIKVCQTKELSEHASGVAKKYYQFESNSYFYSIYISRGEYTYVICANLANNFPTRMAELFAWVRTASRIPGDSSTMDESEMVFTGRVYLYTQDDLSPEQIGELHKIYNHNNLHLEYRGAEYLTHHVWEYERRNDNELKQFKSQPDHAHL